MLESIRDSFAKEFNRCFLCGIMAPQCFPPRLESHEVARGADREKAKDMRSCLIRTCPMCHADHLDGMQVAKQLAIKKLFDPEGYNRTEVNVLRSKHNLRGPQPDAITECDVLEEVDLLKQQIEETGTGYPYLRKKWQ